MFEQTDEVGLAGEVCGCYACIGSTPVTEGHWLTLGMTRMIVCGECGNKRCPHGTDHRHACTGSNDGDQPGSRYQYAPTAALGAQEAVEGDLPGEQGGSGRGEGREVSGPQIGSERIEGEKR